MKLSSLVAFGLVRQFLFGKCAQNPKGIILNEIFTFGHPYYNGYPYIELSRASVEETDLDKYSIVVYALKTRKMFSFRAIIDLQMYKFMENQQIGIIGDGSFNNKLLDIDSRM